MKIIDKQLPNHDNKNQREKIAMPSTVHVHLQDIKKMFTVLYINQSYVLLSMRKWACICTKLPSNQQITWKYTFIKKTHKR